MSISTYIRKLSFLLVACVLIIYSMFYTSCANMTSGPQGGPKDSIPPVVIKSVPEPYSLNYSGKQIVLTFDEYAVPDKLNEKLVISPPLAKRPEIKTKGKTLIIDIEEELIPDRTYSIDFKDGIKDYNEGNKMESFRMLFSTFDQIDTLRISGYVYNSFTLEPVENVFITAYTIHHDSVFLTMKPDFIASTNAEGFYMFDNLPKGEYRLFALTDGDNNLFYSQETEEIAYLDSLLYPEARWINKIDTLLHEDDTLISYGYTIFDPEGINLKLFSEDYYAQFLDSYKRTARDRMDFIFSESLTDSFELSIVNPKFDNSWRYWEFGKKRDTINVWITDTLVSKIDTFEIRLAYTVKDTSQQFVTLADTLEMTFVDDEKEVSKTKKKKSKEDDEEEEEEKVIIPTFSFKTNLKSKDFDLDKKIIITSGIPINPLKKEHVHLEIYTNDTTTVPVNFELKLKEQSLREYILKYDPKSESKYILTIDSGVVQTLTGIVNDGFKNNFETRTSEYYGTLLMNISGINGSYILQVLKDSKDEKLVKQVVVPTGAKQPITIAYLYPGTYRIKLIDDWNENGEWDTGNYEKHQQPEAVYYFEKVIEVKENWDYTEDWLIVPGSISVKDYEKEETDKSKTRK